MLLLVESLDVFALPLPGDAVRCLIINKPFQGAKLLIYPVSVLKKCARKLKYKEAQKLDKLLSWAQNKFGMSCSDSKLLPLVKYGRLEVIFYQHKILITQCSLNACLGSSTSNVGIKKNNSARLNALIVYLENADVVAVGLRYSAHSSNRAFMTIDGAKEYLKTICRSPNATTVLEWIEREVEPAARKHLAALEAQEAKETKEMPLLFNAETVPAVVTAPAVPTYEELLAPWQATLKAQEDALKELEAVKADLASRIARIDEQNADIEFFVKKTNDYEDERYKLNEEIEAKEKEIEGLKNRIIELEDKDAYQVGVLSGNETKLKEYAEIEKRFNELKEAVENSLDNYIGSYYFGISDPDESLQQLIKEMEAYKETCDEERERLEENNKELAQMKTALAAKDAELAKFKAFKDMMQSFMKEESASSPAEVNTTQSEGDVPPGWVEIAPGVKCTGLF